MTGFYCLLIFLPRSVLLGGALKAGFLHRQSTRLKMTGRLTSPSQGAGEFLYIYALLGGLN